VVYLYLDNVSRAIGRRGGQPAPHGAVPDAHA